MLAESLVPGARGEKIKIQGASRVIRIFDAWACIIALEKKIKVQRTCSVTDDPSSMDANARVSDHPRHVTWKARARDRGGGVVHKWKRNHAGERRGATRSGGGDSTVISILGEQEKRVYIYIYTRLLYMYTGITRTPMGTRMYARGPFAPQALYTYSNWIIRATRRVDSKSFDGLASPKQASIVPLRRPSAARQPLSVWVSTLQACRPLHPD